MAKGPGGKELAKVLAYYGLLNEVEGQKIVCPFHKDVNPSMRIDLEEGRYFCFGCQRHGNAMDFVYEAEKKNGLNQLQSLMKYQKILKSKKIEKIVQSGIQIKKKKKRSSQELYDEAYMHYYGLSIPDWENPERKEIEDVKQYMINRGFTAKTLVRIKAKYTYQKNYPIIFPIMDNKEFKGWVCRTTDKKVEAKRKYLYNKGFQRKTTLAGRYSQKCDLLYIVEGYMDMLKLRQFGIKNVVALLGWKASSDQLEKIKKADPKIIIALTDNDQCGRKGARYLKQMFSSKVVRFKFLKGYKDPGDMDLKSFKIMNSKTLEELGGRK